jgi:hypothetical protein
MTLGEFRKSIADQPDSTPCAVSLWLPEDVIYAMDCYHPCVHYTTDLIETVLDDLHDSQCEDIPLTVETLKSSINSYLENQPNV